jgi:hypothetical protein
MGEDIGPRYGLFMGEGRDDIVATGERIASGALSFLF